MIKAESNKTIIPGIAGNPQSCDDAGGFYGRSVNTAQGKTYIPNAYRPNGTKQEETNTSPRVKNIELQERVIAGVLYSMSRLYTGEIFPIYVGRNTIGRDKGCDICLQEESVSTNHAVLLVRNIENEERQTEMTVSITDYDSEYGTKVGDEPLGFDKVTCYEHDIISIGRCYKFMLCLFDAPAYGMYVDENFRQAHTPDEDTSDTSKLASQPNLPLPELQYTVSEPIAGSESIPDFYKPSRKSKKKAAPANETIINKTIRKK